MLGTTVLFHVAPDVAYPAIVTAVFDGPDGHPNLNLQVILDGPNAVQHGFSLDDAAQGMCWKGTVAYGDGVGFWSWSPQPDHGDEGFSYDDVCEVTSISVDAFNAGIQAGDSREDALAAAVAAAVAHGQVIDLRDGSDDEDENPDEYAVYVNFIVDIYEARIADGDSPEDAKFAACAAVWEMNSEQGCSNPEPGDEGADGNPLTVLEWLNGNLEDPCWPLEPRPEGSPGTDPQAPIPPEYTWQVVDSGPDGEFWGWGPPEGGSDSGSPPAIHGEGRNAYEHRTGQGWPWPDPTSLWFENERGTAPDGPTGNGCTVPHDFDFENVPHPMPWTPCSPPPQD